jgi:RNA polymerase sigma factor (sigma-70 family)
MHDDDERLLERIREGDGESFGLLYDRTRDWLLDFVVRPRVGPADAEDVLAETYRTALDKVRGFEWRGVGLLHWLASIAKLKALERVRSRSRGARLEDDDACLVDLPDDAPSAEAAMIAAEARETIRRRVETTLAGLSPRYAEVLRLRLLEGRERQECARTLGVSTATFDVVLYRATRSFARKWSDG